MTRYVTNHYQTNNAAYAKLFSNLDHTETIKVTEGVSPVHVASTWVYWSDDRIVVKTPRIMKRPPATLSWGAICLIDLVLAADTWFVEGGIESLVGIDRVVLRYDLIKRRLQSGRRIRVAWHRVSQRDGTERVFSMLSVHPAWGSGYACDIYWSLENLMASPRFHSAFEEVADVCVRGGETLHLGENPMAGDRRV